MIGWTDHKVCPHCQRKIEGGNYTMSVRCDKLPSLVEVCWLFVVLTALIFFAIVIGGS